MPNLSHVRLVEIEIHSYCNRKCGWCPNQFIDRTNTTELPKDTYEKILDDLKTSGFKGALSYSRYNEPMTLPELFKERVAAAREALPHVKLVSNTNGDYLSRENLEDLLIDELTVMDYDCKGLWYCIAKMKQVGIECEKVRGNLVYGYTDTMKVLYYADWPKHTTIQDRGGFLGKYSKSERLQECYEPLYFIGIDYNGSVVPCCNIRSDNPEHAGYVLGNVNTHKLSEICSKEKAEKIINETPHLIPCKYCSKEVGRYTREVPGIDFI